MSRSLCSVLPKLGNFAALALTVGLLAAITFTLASVPCWLRPDPPPPPMG